MASERILESFEGHSVDFGQIDIRHDPSAADDLNVPFQNFQGDRGSHAWKLWHKYGTSPKLKKKSGRPLDDRGTLSGASEMVARMGFEPMISALRGQRPRPLDERAESGELAF